MTDQEIEKAENTVRKALKDLDLTHVEAVVFLCGSLKPLLDYLYTKNLALEFLQIFRNHKESDSAFTTCMYHSMNILNTCQDILMDSDTPKT